MKIHESVFIAPGAVVMGDVTIEKDCSIWYHATVRGDRTSIVIGQGSNIQDNCVVHGDPGHPVRIGAGVTVGHGAILHGCVIEENTLIGMGAILLNGCHIGKNCIVGAGALVTGDTVIPDNSVVLGNPGKIKREVKPEEAEANRRNALSYVEEGRESRAPGNNYE